VATRRARGQLLTLRRALELADACLRGRPRRRLVCPRRRTRLGLRGAAPRRAPARAAARGPRLVDQPELARQPRRLQPAAGAEGQPDRVEAVRGRLLCSLALAALLPLALARPPDRRGLRRPRGSLARAARRAWGQRGLLSEGC
jgi:hypothetical protein